MKTIFHKLQLNGNTKKQNKKSRDSDRNHDSDGVYEQNAILLHGSKHSFFQECNFIVYEGTIAQCKLTALEIVVCNKIYVKSTA